MFSDRLENLLPDLRAYARVLCADVTRADDIVQNACLKAWKNRADFDESKGAMKGWLFRIVRNEFYSQVRAERVRAADTLDQVEHELVADGGLEPRQNLSRMLSAVASLKDAQRDAFLLVAAAGFTYEEAGEVLGCSAGTVKSRGSRAREIAFGRFNSDYWSSDAPVDSSEPLADLHDALDKIQSVNRAA